MAIRLAMLMVLSVWISQGQGQGRPSIHRRVARPIPQCFFLEGRVSVYNGTPSIRIAPKGTKRLLGVIPPEDEIMPSNLKDAVGLDRDAFAEMEVCPMSESKRGHMQFVCVESAQHIETDSGSETRARLTAPCHDLDPQAVRAAAQSPAVLDFRALASNLRQFYP